MLVNVTRPRVRVCVCGYVFTLIRCWQNFRTYSRYSALYASTLFHIIGTPPRIHPSTRDEPKLCTQTARSKDVRHFAWHYYRNGSRTNPLFAAARCLHSRPSNLYSQRMLADGIYTKHTALRWNSGSNLRLFPARVSTVYLYMLYIPKINSLVSQCVVNTIYGHQKWVSNKSPLLSQR